MDNSSSQRGKEQLNVMSPSDSALVAQYKDLIRDQDMQIQTLKQTVETLTKNKIDLEVKFQLCYLKLSWFELSFSLLFFVRIFRWFLFGNNLFIFRHKTESSRRR